MVFFLSATDKLVPVAKGKKKIQMMGETFQNNFLLFALYLLNDTLSFLLETQAKYTQRRKFHPSYFNEN